MFNNFSLDSKELNSLVQSTYGNRSDDNVEDILINGPLKFVRCYEEALKQDIFGAYLIITENQYILAKCCDDGKQGHLLSVTKAFLEMEGKNNDVSIIEASRIYPKYSRNFLIFDIEIKKTERSRRSEKTFRTTLNYGSISSEEYEVFKMFYDEYREVLKNCDFTYSIFERMTGMLLPIKNIDHLNRFLCSISDNSIEPPKLENEEKILGIPLSKQKGSQVLKKAL